MKYKIAALESGRQINAWEWTESGAFHAVASAYLTSREAGNELIDFDRALWAPGMLNIFAALEQSGQMEITISAVFGGLLETLAIFTERGWKLDGMVQVFASVPDWTGGPRQLLPAVKLSR